MTTAITDPIDLLLGTDNDIVITGGDLVFASDNDAVAQGVRIAVRMFAGEWFADLSVGVRYIEGPTVPAALALLGQKFDAVKARSEFRREIQAVDGVDEIVSLNVSFDAPTRTLDVNWVCTTVFGETVADTIQRTF